MQKNNQGRIFAVRSYPLDFQLDRYAVEKQGYRFQGVLDI